MKQIVLIIYASILVIAEALPAEEIPVCGVNQEYRCSHGCERHCPEARMQPCDPVPMCLHKGCHCATGFVQDRQRMNACVKSEECAPVVHETPIPVQSCGTTEVLRCGSSCPEAHCPYPVERVPVECNPASQCTSGCFCPEGYVRNQYANNVCIKHNECPPVRG